MQHATFFYGVTFIDVELDSSKDKTVGDIVKSLQEELGFELTDRSRVIENKVILPLDYIAKPGGQYICSNKSEAYG